MAYYSPQNSIAYYATFVNTIEPSPCVLGVSSATYIRRQDVAVCIVGVGVVHPSHRSGGELIQRVVGEAAVVRPRTLVVVGGDVAHLIVGIEGVAIVVVHPLHAGGGADVAGLRRGRAGVIPVGIVGVAPRHVQHTPGDPPQCIEPVSTQEHRPLVFTRNTAAGVGVADPVHRSGGVPRGRDSRPLGLFGLL